MPWNGMPMSGSVEFEHNQREYVIYRSEGLKNGGKVFSIKNPITGTDYAGIDNPGKIFFGVDEVAFSDSCFVQRIVPSGSGSEFVCAFSDLNHDEKTYSDAKEFLEEKIKILTSVKRKESEISRVASRKSEIISEYMSVQKLVADFEQNKQKKEKAQSRLNMICTEIDDFNEQKKMMDHHAEYIRYKKLKEYIKSEKQNNADLKEKIKIQNSDQKHNKTLPQGWSKIFFAVLAVCFIALIFMLMLDKLTVAGLFIAMFPILCAVFYFVIYKKMNSNTYTAGNKDVEDTIKAQILRSDARINEANDEIEFFEKSGKVELYKTMSEHFDINCFTNEEINDIIYSKGKEKEKLISEIARLDAENERYVFIKQKSDVLQNELCCLEKEEREIYRKAEACKLALEILENAFMKHKNSFIPSVTKRAFEIYSSVAQNDSTAIYTDDNFAALIKIKNEFKDSNYLSTASRDLLYISLRIAFCDKVTNKESLPLFFDDVCASFDDIRCKRFLDIAEALASDRQIIFTTCRSREKEYLKNSKILNYINLGKDETNV